MASHNRGTNSKKNQNIQHIDGTMLSVIDDLHSGRINVDEESNTLKSQLDRLLSAYRTREKKYTAAVDTLKANHEGIIKEAQDQAAAVIANAEKVSAEMITNAEKKSAKMIEVATQEAEEIRETMEEEQEEWEAEQASVADIQTFEPIVKINIGGNRFDTSLTTLTRLPETMIGTMFNGRHTLVLDREGYHFIDRDGTHFRHILNFLRSPETFEVNLPEASMKELKSECKYYGLHDVMFPFTPIPSFRMINKAGLSFEISQGSDGIFRYEQLVIKYCTTCDRGEYSSSQHGYFPKFSKSVKANGSEILPQQHTALCRFC